MATLAWMILVFELLGIVWILGCFVVITLAIILRTPMIEPFEAKEPRYRFLLPQSEESALLTQSAGSNSSVDVVVAKEYGEADESDIQRMIRKSPPVILREPDYVESPIY